MSDAGRVRVGVSACLLGHTVRYDGGHKYEPAVSETLVRAFELVPVCPEVELGLGVPREAIRLARVGAEIRLVGRDSGVDHTDAMRAYARRRVRELEQLGLSGYVLKSKSPSCGLAGVEIEGQPDTGRGLFTDELIRHWCELPVEEESALREPAVCERFIQRVVAYARRTGASTP